MTLVHLDSAAERSCRKRPDSQLRTQETATRFVDLRKPRLLMVEWAIPSTYEVNGELLRFIVKALLMNEFFLYFAMALWFHGLPDLDPREVGRAASTRDVYYAVGDGLYPRS